MPLNINGSVVNTQIAKTLNYKNIISRGLALYLDAGAVDSYPEIDTTWYDLAGSNNGTLNNGISVMDGPLLTSIPSARYWRYVEGSAVVSHHPRCSRIMLLDNSGNSTTITTYTSDNCADSGTYIVGTVTYDAGAGNTKSFTNAQIYSTFADGTAGRRAANITVQYSDDNSTWTTAFTGIMANYTYSNGTSVCGIISLNKTNQSNGVLNFDGSNDTVSISAIVNAYPFTVSMWASNPNVGWAPPSGMQELMNMNIAGQRVSLGTVISSGWPTGPTIMYGGSNHYSLDGSGIFTTANRFYNIVYSIAGSNNSSHRIYVNGTSYTPTNNGGAHGGAAGWAIGSNGNSGEFWPGRIANVAVYNRQLSDTEVTQNYNLQKSRFGY
jgi:hypothetical protein